MPPGCLRSAIIACYAWFTVKFTERAKTEKPRNSPHFAFEVGKFARQVPHFVHTRELENISEKFLQYWSRKERVMGASNAFYIQIYISYNSFIIRQ